MASTKIGPWDTKINRLVVGDSSLILEDPGLGEMMFTLDGVEILSLTVDGMQLFDSGPRIDRIYDNDDLSPNSATAIASQQSIKAYVDTAIGAISTDSIEAGDTSVQIVDAGVGSVAVTVDSTLIGTWALAGLTLEDNKSVIFGAAGQVYSDATSIVFANAAGDETLIKATQGGSVELYCNNVKEGETVSGALRATNGFAIGGSQTITAFTGIDLSLVTGTGGTANLGRWNADGDLVAASSAITDVQLDDLVDGTESILHKHTASYINLVDAGGFYDSTEVEAALAEIAGIFGYFNGTFEETFDAVATSNGTVVTMTLEQSGTGDLTMWFSSGKSTLDCTDPVQSIVLTAGTDSAPQENFIYIPESTKVLTKHTSQWPSEEHIKVAYFFVPSAAEVQDHGCFINQNWNDHRTGTDDQGHLSHFTEAFRRTLGGAGWNSGVDPNGDASTYLVTTGSPDEVYFKSAAGVAFQMHKHTIPAINMQTGDDCHVVNWSGDAYHEITDLASIIADSAGGSLNNKYYNLVFWGTANKSGEYSPLMCNVPNGSYNLLSSAIVDADEHDVTTIPDEFTKESTIGFLICRLTMRKSGTTYTLHNTVDLRGVSAGAAAGAGGGGGGGGGTSFADNAFTIFDSDDFTRVLNFDVSSITTGNTRTITPADADMTLLSTTDYTDLTDAGNTALHIHDIYVLADGTRDIAMAPGGDWAIKDTDGDNIAVFTSNGAVDLYHNNVKKFGVLATGVQISGDIYNSVAEVAVVLTANGGVGLYYDNALKLVMTATGATLTGTLVSDGMAPTNLTLGDNEAITFGAGPDAKIYSDGTKLVISNGADDETIATFAQDSEIAFYHNDERVLRTKAGGILVGTLSEISITVAAGAGGDQAESQYSIGDENPAYTAAFDNSFGNSAVNSWYAYYSGGYQTDGWIGQDFGAGNAKTVTAYTITSVDIADRTYDPYDWTFEGSDTGVWGGEETVLDTVTAASFSGQLDEQQFTVDTPGEYRYYRLDVTANFGHPTYLIIAEIEMLGTAAGGSYIDLPGPIIEFRDSSLETFISYVSDGGVILYYDEANRLEMTSPGATLSGVLIADGLSIGDNEYVKFGDGPEAHIYSNGTSLYFTTPTNEYMVIMTPNAGVELYYDHGRQAETKSGEFYITTQLNIAGSTAVTGILDEDAMGSDSAVKLCTQQSIKAYTDAHLTSASGIIVSDTAGALAIIEFQDDATATLGSIEASNNLALKVGSGENGIDVIDGAGVHLYHNNVDVFEVEATGAKVTGTIHATDHATNRNLIINGAMRVSQRGTSWAGLGDGDNYTYTVDRWEYSESGTPVGVLTMSQDTDVPAGEGFANSLKIDCTTVEDYTDTSSYILIDQKIEAQDLQHLEYGHANAKDLTLSIWVKSDTKTGTMSFVLYSPDAAKTYMSPIVIADNSWNKYIITVPGDTAGSMANDNTTGFLVGFLITAGSAVRNAAVDTWEAAKNALAAQGNFLDNTANNVWITGVQLEVGSADTTFEHHSFGEYLALCQRYYERIEWVDSNDTIVGTGHCLTTSEAHVVWDFKVKKRDNPTMSWDGTASNFRLQNGNGGDDLTGMSAFLYNSPFSVVITCDDSTVGFTAFSGCELRINSTGGWIDADAEL